ncbi:MAG: hypothetical protein N0E42_04580, partial [Candidatus Thiodiazotropha endolucinida]|nr:hypothetical protein [Candidatus Thiodiazotropha taylori]MCW4223754.1 hypothetical protein [Candidatus Thiodiazotropha endolucinida]
EEIRSREEILQAREDSLCRLADIFIGRVNRVFYYVSKLAMAALSLSCLLLRRAYLQHGAIRMVRR